MKIFGIDDNSEAFSLLVTVIIGILLFIFSYTLNKRVMAQKAQTEVGVDTKKRLTKTYRADTFLFSQMTTLLNGKQLFNGISKETAKDFAKIN
jgi:Na+/melibiose symporter-like transporter